MAMYIVQVVILYKGIHYKRTVLEDGKVEWMRCKRRVVAGRTQYMTVPFGAGHDGPKSLESEYQISIGRLPR